MPYHVILELESQLEDEVKLDLSKEHLTKRVLDPYLYGDPIRLSGKTITVSDVKRIRVTYTEADASQIRPQVEAEERSRLVKAPISFNRRIADKGEDVTDDMLEERDNEKRAEGSEEVILDSGSTAEAADDPTKVFVVHGRNSKLRTEVFTFLRALGLNPMEWSTAVKGTKSASPYIGEILKYAFDTAQAVVVLLSPDDEARLKEEFRSDSEQPQETEFSGQARQNVIFEAGMAMAWDENRTVLIQAGEVRPFSDIAGRHVVKLANNTEIRQEIAQRLSMAGCSVETSGTDWHSVGDLTP